MNKFETLGETSENSPLSAAYPGLKMPGRGQTDPNTATSGALSDAAAVESEIPPTQEPFCETELYAPPNKVTLNGWPGTGQKGPINEGS